MRVLLTGGCGYIGSHQAVALLEGGHEVVLVDDLSNSDASTVKAIGAITGREPPLHVLDVRDTPALRGLMSAIRPDAVIHFAGLKHIAESHDRPHDYYDVNVGGLLSLLSAGSSTQVTRLIFSSSGSVYGEVGRLPISEDTPTAPSNPYSASKAICEQILEDVCAGDERWSVAALRYFNPAGAHESALIGEAPTHLISNLVPVLMDAAWREAEVRVNGDDYDTVDGTAVRDYIHVCDVVEAHRRALDLVTGEPGFRALNIGRGVGASILDLIGAARAATGAALPVTVGPRRPGDVSALVADTSRARELLGEWPHRTVEDIIEDAWRWQQRWRSGSGRLVAALGETCGD